MIKNYTSSVKAEDTIARIELILSKNGATGISKDYEDGKVTALTFLIPVENRSVSIRLPANPDAVFRHMYASKKQHRPGTEQRVKEQAHRTAWKLMQDWVEVQLSLIQMKQAELMQVFLPYAWDGKQTFYASLKLGQFKSLPYEGKVGDQSHA